MAQGSAFFTPELLDEAIRLRDTHGMRWKAIAERLGVERWQSLTTSVSRYRKGKATFKRMADRKRTEQMCAMAEAGRTPRQIAAAMGITEIHAYVRLAHHGFDAEVRRLYQSAA